MFAEKKKMSDEEKIFAAKKLWAKEKFIEKQIMVRHNSIILPKLLLYVELLKKKKKIETFIKNLYRIKKNKRVEVIKKKEKKKILFIW